MEGAASGRELALQAPYAENDALQYAAVRNILHSKGKSVEILADYEPTLHYVAEWWKQLYGESEGKGPERYLSGVCRLYHRPAFSGQFIQDGSRIMFETVLAIEEPKEDVVIKAAENDLDGLNYLAGKGMDFVNKSV